MDANGFRFVRRRSDRLYQKQRSEVLSTSCNGTLGIFCILPVELHHAILDHLTHSDLAKLSTTSSLFASVVREYIVSGKHLEALLFPFARALRSQPWPNPNGILETFSNLGDLLRSMSCLMQTKEKFRLLTAVLAKLQSVHTMILSEAGSSTAYSCFGAMLKQLVRGWCFNDRRCVFQLIWQEACLDARCKQVFSTAAGSLPRHELDLRLLLRNVFLRHTDLTVSISKHHAQMPQDFHCWLTLLLKAWPLVHQARLLVMLFGPLHHATGAIDWRKLCSPQNSGCGKQDLAELAFVLSSLYTANCFHTGGEYATNRQLEWVPDQVVSIVDEATALPQGWSLDNMGQLLQQLCRPLTVNLLQCYAANGRLSELAHLVLHLAIVCADENSSGSHTKNNSHEAEGDLTYFVSVLSDVMVVFQMGIRRQFLQQFFITWHEHIMDIFHLAEDFAQMNVAVNRMTRMCEVLSRQLFVS